MTYKIAPTDLTFLLDDCPACFYRKVKLGICRPYTPFPSVFNKIDDAMKRYFHQRSPSEWGLPEGVIDASNHSLKSRPIEFRSGGTSVVFAGKPDAIAQFSDGAWGLFDFKTSEAKASHLELYKRQLHCGRDMMNLPGKGEPRWVTRLGILAVVPSLMREGGGKVLFEMDVSYQEVAVDQEWWFDFMGGIVGTLDGDEPAPKEGCFYCELHQYREKGRSLESQDAAAIISGFAL